MSDTHWYTGLGLVEDAIEVGDGIRNHSWVDATLGSVGGSLDALGVVLDPLGSMMAWGVGWLIEHVEPLKEALDHLAGNPYEVATQAASWQAVSVSIGEAHQRYETALRLDVAGWSGAAGDAYRSGAAEQSAVVQGLVMATRAVSYAVEGAGLLVALVREIVRDLIAQFVATLAARLPQWLAMEGLTLGIATPAVVSQVAGLVARWVGKIQNFVRALVGSLRRLAGKLDALAGIMRQLSQSAQRLARTNPTATRAARILPFAGYRQTGGEIRRPRNAMDYESQWADDAYDNIRLNDDDIPAIAAAAREHGFTLEDIARIKSHLFREKHLLDSYSAGEMGRFDANPRIAEAWQRLERGQPHAADLDLLRHERFEAEFMSRTGDLSYRRAHAATLDAGFTWDPEAAAADGLGYQRGY